MATLCFVLALSMAMCVCVFGARYGFEIETNMFVHRGPTSFCPNKPLSDVLNTAAYRMLAGRTEVYRNSAQRWIVHVDVDDADLGKKPTDPHGMQSDVEFASISPPYDVSATGFQELTRALDGVLDFTDKMAIPGEKKKMHKHGDNKQCRPWENPLAPKYLFFFSADWKKKDTYTPYGTPQATVGIKLQRIFQVYEAVVNSNVFEITAQHKAFQKRAKAFWQTQVEANGMDHKVAGFIFLTAYYMYSASQDFGAGYVLKYTKYGTGELLVRSDFVSIYNILPEEQRAQLSREDDTSLLRHALMLANLLPADATEEQLQAIADTQMFASAFPVRDEDCKVYTTFETPDGTVASHGPTRRAWIDYIRTPVVKNARDLLSARHTKLFDTLLSMGEWGLERGTSDQAIIEFRMFPCTSRGRWKEKLLKAFVLIGNANGDDVSAELLPKRARNRNKHLVEPGPEPLAPRRAKRLRGKDDQQLQKKQRNTYTRAVRTGQQEEEEEDEPAEEEEPQEEAEPSLPAVLSAPRLTIRDEDDEYDEVVMKEGYEDELPSLSRPTSVRSHVEPEPEPTVAVMQRTSPPPFTSRSPFTGVFSTPPGHHHGLPRPSVVSLPLHREPEPVVMHRSSHLSLRPHPTSHHLPPMHHTHTTPVDRSSAPGPHLHPRTATPRGRDSDTVQPSSSNPGRQNHGVFQRLRNWFSGNS
eukprot:GILK01004924.1.p1 GENE.GILK01004924.1~~GILK01004924.1.p1  ORF type:complete len:712 (+),score=69.53 GILK01004924.1:47-2137(+)